MDTNTAGHQVRTYDAAKFIEGVDQTAWDMTLYCGSCHVGGSWGEKDRNGRRHSSPQAMQAQGMGMAMSAFDPFLFMVQERFEPTTGMPKHVVKPSPWAYPGYIGMNPANGPIMPAASGAPGAMGWGQAAMGPGVTDGQLMMPNVKEMDCLFCHFEGYNNVMASVMTLGGMFTMAPMAGSGIMDTNSLSPTYQGYNAALVNYSTAGFGRNVVSLKASTIAKIKPNPPSQNCRLCHSPTSLTDLPSFMKDFLSNAPTIFTGYSSATSPFTGLSMPSFDFNAPFAKNWNVANPLAPAPAFMTSPKLTKAEVGMAFQGMPGFEYAFIPSIGFPAAMGGTVYNTIAGMTGGPYGAPGSLLGVNMAFGPDYGVEIGGGNPVGTGPLYFESFVEKTNPMSGMDQNVLKKSTMPFPRADWFKRGDLWDDATVEVHYSFGCEGCHMDTATTKVDTASFDGKSLCDPGRGFDSAGGVESNPLFLSTMNSQNTVKRCENCHVSGKNSDGVAIETFGAPNPNAIHATYGLASTATSPKVRAIRANADGSGEEYFLGSHMDIVECTVCHVRKNTQVVRALDSTSGMRYPNMLGFRKNEGMMGMFSSPPNASVQNSYDEWTPLFTWQKIGNGFKQINGVRNEEYRRKIYPINMITAIIWNNEDPTVDANGDGIVGREPTEYNLTGTTPHAIATNYDPWISRDMKAGMNFGPSGFAPIPVGFGPGAFQSAYNQNGSFTGAWQYVGVYGGNVLFTTPEEIAGYKAYRTAIKDAPGMGGKSWDGTKLLYIPGPYMVTHNVRKTDMFVRGKSCADCHAPGKDFFDGGFNITGTAIKAVANQQFMASPAEIAQVVAHAEDLVTGAELASKNGAAREIPAEVTGCWNAATKTFTMNNGSTCTSNAYKKIVDLDRSTVFYPDTTNVTGADGVDRTPGLHINRLLQIGAAPVATISNAVDAQGYVATNVGSSLTLNAADQLNPNFEYSWTFNDNQGAATGQSVSRSFPSATYYVATLHVKNKNTGEIKTAKKTIKVLAAVPQNNFTAAATNVARVVTLNLSGMPAHAKIQVAWGDSNNTYTTSAASYSPKHTYYAAGAKTITIKLVSSTGTIVGQTTATTAALP